MARVERTIDIHNFAHTYALAEAAVRRAEISDRNRELILGYRSACLLKGTCGKVRLIRVMGALTLFARTIDKDFDRLTRKDLEELVTRLLSRQPAYSPETMGTYRAILRTFMTWVLVPDEFPTKHAPAMVSWLSGHVKEKDRHRLERHELLTPEEIKMLIDVADNARDKALIHLLWESGARISEPGSMQIKHLTKEKFGYSADFFGKTGHRCVLLVACSYYLTQWLAVHPYRNDPESPLWVYNQHTTTPRHLGYQAFRTLLQRYMKRAGINKRIYPHLFRHSRPTYCASNNIFNNSQQCAFFGWKLGSRMPAHYARLSAQDARNAILKENGITPPEPAGTILTATKCPACNTLNPNTTPYCTQCNTVLDEQGVRRHVAKQDFINAAVVQMVKVLADQGLMNEVTDQLHREGLGEALDDLLTSRQPGNGPASPSPSASNAGLTRAVKANPSTGGAIAADLDSPR